MEPWLENLIGVRYVEYGNTPEEGFHCTGLVRYVIKTKFGKEIPNDGDVLKWKTLFNDLGWPVQLKPYDIVVMENEDMLPHIGIAVDRFNVLHAWKSAGGVVLSKIEHIGKIVTTVARLK